MSIVRVWRGWARADMAGAYQEHFEHSVLPHLGSIAGIESAQLWRRESDIGIEFVAVSQFESVEAVKRFAGEDYAVAVIAPEARVVLQAVDERCHHYTVVQSFRKSL